MGTTGASGLKEVIIGSFAADTMTKAPCPVLAIPKNCKFKIPEKIIFASDYNKKDNQAIIFLSKWNEKFKTKICVLHIDDGEYTFQSEEEEFNNYKNTIERQCKGIPISFHHVDGKDISKALLHFTMNEKADILAISPITSRGIWNRLFHKSITKATAYHVRIPLLTIPIK